MQRFGLFRLLFLSLFSLALIGSSQAADKPNLLILYADDLGWGELGCQGCKDIPTPNIDSIAKNGIRCSNGYVSGPYCSPTRAGLMTGRYQTRFGHEFNPGANAPADVGLSLKETTIADRLKAAGYATGLVGKWHLGADPKHHPQKRGFDEFFGFLGGAHPYIQDRGILRGTRLVARALEGPRAARDIGLAWRRGTARRAEFELLAQELRRLAEKPAR